MWHKSIIQDFYGLKISGIIKPKKDADAQMLNEGIGYTSLLTKEIIRRGNESEVVKAQLNSPLINVLTGKPFESNTGKLSPEVKKTSFLNYVSGLTNAKKKEVYIAIKCLMTPEQLSQETFKELANYPTREAQQALVSNAMAEQLQMDPAMLESYLSEMSDEQIYGYVYAICQEIAKMKYQATVGMGLMMQPEETLAGLLDVELQSATLEDFGRYYDEVTDFSDLSYDEVLILLGCLNEEEPSSINLFTSSFENKDLISAAIKKYNNSVEDSKKIA